MHISKDQQVKVAMGKVASKYVVKLIIIIGKQTYKQNAPGMANERKTAKLFIRAYFVITTNFFTT
jgi:hypothetical protein